MGGEGNNQIAIRVAPAGEVWALTLFQVCIECPGLLVSRRDMVNDGVN